MFERSVERTASRDDFEYPWNEINAMVPSIAKITMTMMSSTKVKPPFLIFFIEKIDENILAIL